MTTLGVVAIGRNEGERLRRCIASILLHTSAIVYVDSGSTDDSLAWARSQGVATVELDLSLPFTAARARNEGFAKLLEANPEIEFVQFVDGDCEINPSWLERARQELMARPDAAVVCGRRRERFPNASIYNRLCDREWETPLGEADACGGDALFRVGPFCKVQGYRGSLVAGEEPELCLRLRGAGWKILRIDAEMTLHDAAMTHVGQWWKRNVRAGYAYAECSWLHRAGPLRLWGRENRTNWFWGLLLPLAILAAIPFTYGLSLVLLLGYLVLGWRVFRGRRRGGEGTADARMYATFCILGKFPQVSGQMRYHWGRLFSRPSRLIEYKGSLNGPRFSGLPRLAYLVTYYPHVSHSFVRREIAALEACGFTIDRYSIRRSEAALVDPADIAEHQRTEVILARGFFGLLADFLTVACIRPIRFVKALHLTFKMGRRSPKGVFRHLIYAAEACVLFRCLRRSGVRHLHAHFGTNSTAIALLTKILGGPPYSFTIHGPDEFDHPESLSLDEKIARAAFVVAVSEYGRSQVFRWCEPRHWGKIHVVRCGVDATFLRGEPQPVPATNRLVCVGRLCPAKGQLRLLEALKRLAAEGIPFEMVLAGDGPMRREIEREIQRLGLGVHVRITGWVSNDAVRKYLLESRAMVLPSFAEGLPVVIMEALALGRPVVSTYVAGIPELVENGVNGFLAPAGSIDALTAALREVLAAPTERLSEMGRIGMAQVRLRHDAAREASQLATLFQRT
jgi:glycosyltransferase involved in cell wall biosynthesis/GT2 family glycosyltransferase